MALRQTAIEHASRQLRLVRGCDDRKERERSSTSDMFRPRHETSGSDGPPGRLATVCLGLVRRERVCAQARMRQGLDRTSLRRLRRAQGWVWRVPAKISSRHSRTEAGATDHEIRVRGIGARVAARIDLGAPADSSPNRLGRSAERRRALAGPEHVSSRRESRRWLCSQPLAIADLILYDTVDLRSQSQLSATSPLVTALSNDRRGKCKSSPSSR